MSPASITPFSAVNAVTAVTAINAVAPAGSVAADGAAAAAAAAPSGSGRGSARAAGEFARALDRAGAARAGAPRTGTAREHAGVDPARLAGRDRPVSDDRVRASEDTDTALAAATPPATADIDPEAPSAEVADASAADRLLTELHALHTPAPSEAAAASALAVAGTATKPTLRTPPAPGGEPGPGHDACAAATPMAALNARAQAQARDPGRDQAPGTAEAPALTPTSAEARPTAPSQAQAQGQPQSVVQLPTPAPATTPPPMTAPASAELASVVAVELTAARPEVGDTPVVAPAPLLALPSAPPPAGATVTAEARLAAAPGSTDFAHQFGAQVTTFVREGVEHARLHLNPVELGPVTVRIRLDGDAAQVHLAVEHPLTRQALEQSMPLLAGSLREAGLTLSGGGVFEQPRQSGDGAPPSARGAAGNGRHADADLEPALHTAAVPVRRRGVVDLVA